VLKEVLAPLKMVEKEWERTNRQLWAAYESEREKWKRDGKRACKPEPKRPRMRRKIVMDITTEALVECLAANPNGLLCFQDELAGWAGNMDAYRPNKGQSKDQPFWLSAKGGGAYQVDRKLTGPLSVDCNAVHLVGGIQPDVLRKCAPDWSGNGLLQRFLLVNMERSGVAPDLPVDEAARKAVYDAIRLISRLEWSEFSQPYTFSAEADEIRKRVAEFAVREVAAFGTPRALAGWLDKLEGEWARLAVVLHHIQWATGPGAEGIEDAPRLVIDAESAESWRVICWNSNIRTNPTFTVPSPDWVEPVMKMPATSLAISSHTALPKSQIEPFTELSQAYAKWNNTATRG
jgi:hypothetical protein